jgi:hypothetical protein
MRRVLTAIALAMLLAAAEGRAAWELSTVEMAAPVPVWVMNCPDGDGQALDEANGPGGAPADATITLTVIYPDGVPAGFFPATDIWLQVAEGWLPACDDVLHPDADCDRDGVTTFTGPFAAGHCAAGVEVWVGGEAVPAPPLDIHFNSPDVNGDLRVSLTDVVLFAQSYFGTYDACMDLNHDGALNLSDVVILTTHLEHDCP